MCPETEKGNYGVVLTSCNASKQESAAEALRKAFKFDAKTSNTVLERAPIVVFEGLTETVGKLVLEEMKGLSDAGCELKLVAAPFETKRKLTWPKPHAFVRQALDDAAKAPAEGTVEIICPKCGEKFAFDSTAQPAPQAATSEKETVEEIEELEEEILPAAEVPISDALPEASDVSDDIMDLDEFETSLEEIDIESPSSGDGGEDELEAMASAKAVEPAKAPPPELKKTVRYEKPKEASPAAAGGDGVYRVILSKMRSDKVRNDAAEIIAHVQGISQGEALRAAGKLIVTAVKDVSEEKANEIKSMFTEKDIKAIVSKRK